MVGIYLFFMDRWLVGDIPVVVNRERGGVGGWLCTVSVLTALEVVETGGHTL